MEDFHRIIQLPWAGQILTCMNLLPGEDDLHLLSLKWKVPGDYGEILPENILHIGSPKIMDEYDFGDGWMHEIRLEKINILNKKMGKPIRLSGSPLVHLWFTGKGRRKENFAS